MTFALTLLALVAIGSPAFAADSDVVVLTNGNRMTGSVTELSRGELSFSIDGAGSVDIDWTNVASLTCSHALDIELGSGERLHGSISSPEPGKLEVRSDAGSTKVVAMTDVVRMTPVAATFVERTSGSIEAGLSFLQANDEIDLTLSAEAENRTRNYLTEASFTSLLRRRDDASTLRRNHFDIGSRRFLSNRWFVLGQGEVEEDTKLSLDLRVLVFGAVGRTLVQSHRTALGVYGGLDYDLEQYEDIPGTDHSVEALGAVEWEWFELGSSTTVSADATTYVSLERSRVRFDVDAGIEHDIVRNYYVTLEFFGAFDSDPPEGLDDSDIGLALAVGRSF